MKPLKQSEVIALLESYGFRLIRSNGHLVYANGLVRIALSHGRIVSPGVMRSVTKAIKQAQPTERTI